MIWVLKWILFGHVHKWQETGRETVEGRAYDGRAGKVGYAVYCTCKTCGLPRSFRV